MVAGDTPNIIAAGGDGSISAAATAIIGTNKNLGVIPLGTFNYFAKDLGVPLEIDSAVEVFKSGRPTQKLVGKVNDLVFLNNASIGIYPRVLKEREQIYKKWGRNRVLAYYSVITTLLKPQPSISMRIALENEEATRSSPFLFVAGNAFQLESFNLPGQKCLAQNTLAVYVSRPYKKLKMLKHAVMTAMRHYKKDEQFEQFCAKNLWIDTPNTSLKVAVDGEIHDLKTPLHFRMEPQGLNVWMPGA